MIIDSYDVKASSQRSYMSVQSTTLTAKTTLITEPEEERENADGEAASVSLSDEFKKMREKTLEELQNQLSKTETPSPAEALRAGKGPKNSWELKLTLLEMILEKLTGKKMRLRQRDNPQSPGLKSAMNMQGHSPLSGGVRAHAVDSWQIESFRYESESVSYQAQGVVKTADGKTINVDINMYMSREFASYTNINIQSERQVCDPLVINYGGTAASLTGENFDFDLTMDGQDEKISRLGEGSGFLALDKNGDGQINDGSELFGPSSGSGFEELRSYDSDGNNWIDERDDIFSKLTVWSRDAEGNDQLFTLSELGIGAIYLGDVETQFSFKDDANQTAGVMRSTSFFLKEDGGAGTISHIDLAV